MHYHYEKEIRLNEIVERNLLRLAEGILYTKEQFQVLRERIEEESYKKPYKGEETLAYIDDMIKEFLNRTKLDISVNVFYYPKENRIIIYGRSPLDELVWNSLFL